MSDLMNRIESVLADKGLRVSDLVRATGIADSTIRGWRKGIDPSATNLYKVSSFLNIPMEFFVSGEISESKEVTMTREQKREIIENDIKNELEYLSVEDVTLLHNMVKRLQCSQ